MNKKGFTLVELLGVILILALIAVIGSASISGVTKMIKKGMWQSEIEIIENGAIRYGEDNLYRLRQDGTDKCAFMNEEPSESLHCLEVTVEYLLTRNYIVTDDRDEEGNKIIINNETGKSVNNDKVYVWMENNNVYAHYEES